MIRNFDITSDGKSMRLDVYVKDGDGVTVYDLEIQTTSQDDLPQRLRYYQGMIDLSLIEKGASYGELRKSYIIFICTFDPFERGLCCYRFENFCCDDKDLPLNDGAVKIILNSRGCIKESDATIIQKEKPTQFRKVTHECTGEMYHAPFPSRLNQMPAQEGAKDASPIAKLDEKL